MAPSSSITSPTATATSSVSDSHKRTFPFAALILLALCIAYIVGYLVYRRILNSWNAKQNAEKVQNFPDEFFEKKPRGPHRFTWTHGIWKSKAIGENTESEPHRSFSSSPDEKPLVSPPPVAMIKEHASGGPTITQSQRDVRTAFPKRIARAAREKGSRVLSRGRVTEIKADPKLAPVQGPLRPLSILLSRNKERERVSFNLA
ncbi:uncharacterized protein BJ212DRAFT_1302141 [Suillus subaureus]|uniref:Uncharacterized protein n=1 Tax=Suillus subaureus TaxID=48587 RepID=A0A9P7E585_9AGAM|nr:uncharacterized protein BJ212DRAFT_1302141 [Suillus subaureus]KAG1811269.1 hypothetical protein BJ212DRAFT_1302141 [Suillus subaureus]